MGNYFQLPWAFPYCFTIQRSPEHEEVKHETPKATRPHLSTFTFKISRFQVGLIPSLLAYIDTSLGSKYVCLFQGFQSHIFTVCQIPNC